MMTYPYAKYVEVGCSYIDLIAIDIYNEGKPENPPDTDEMRLYRIYAVLALAKGTQTTLKDVHDAWVAWKADTMPEHRSLIPFQGLAPKVQALDEPYRDAIHAVARRHNLPGRW